MHPSSWALTTLGIYTSLILIQRYSFSEGWIGKPNGEPGRREEVSMPKPSFGASLVGLRHRYRPIG